MQKKIEIFKPLCKEDRANAIYLMDSLQGWNAYAMHANSYKLRRIISNKAIEIIKH